MQPGKVRFDAVQGSTFSRVLTYKVDGSPVDISGWDARMQIREFSWSEEPVLTLATTAYGMDVDGPAGKIYIQIGADEMAAFTPGNYVFDLDVIVGDRVDTLIYGDFVVQAEVTR